TLAHQISLVHHILQNEHLRRVLIADEVGLGKTVEVALLLNELFSSKPGLRAVYRNNFDKIVKTGPWDVIIVDECHHLSDWAEGSGDPVEKYRLVRELAS